MSGNGIAGVLVGALRIFTKLALPNHNYISIVIFFSITCAILIICIGCYFALFRFPIALYYMNRKRNTKEGEASYLMKKKTKKWWEGYWKILKKVKLEAFEVFLVFFITLSLFPGMSLTIESTSGLSSDWFGVLIVVWFAVLLFYFIYFFFFFKTLFLVMSNSFEFNQR